MDFAVCPSCHQSVLDDDAVDCPFCGASMKAKPGAKPAAAAAKSPAAAKPVAGKAAPSKPTLPGDDLPFESELTAGKSAIPAMPSATKQRTWQVICPMCDTPGYSGDHRTCCFAIWSGIVSGDVPDEQTQSETADG